MDMKCNSVRESLSAIIDGEDSPLAAEEVHSHLSGCGACRSWHARILALHEETSLQSALPALDIAAAVMAATAVPDTSRRLVRGARLALVFVALAQVVSALVTLSGIHDVGHQGHELVMFEAALGLGFAAVALRPERAWGMAPLLVLVALGFVVTAAIDVVMNNAGLASETAHLLEIGGAALVAGISRMTMGMRARTAAIPAANV